MSSKPSIDPSCSAGQRGVDSRFRALRGRFELAGTGDVPDHEAVCGGSSPRPDARCEKSFEERRAIVAWPTDAP